MNTIVFSKTSINKHLLVFIAIFNISACMGSDNTGDEEILNMAAVNHIKTATSISELRSILQSAQPGDTLQISGTIAVSDGTIETSRPGSKDKYIVIKGINSGRLDFTGYANAACLKIAHDYYKIFDLTIDANGNSKRGLLIFGANHGHVANVEIRKTLNEAFKIKNNSRFWYFEHCGVISSGLEGRYGEGFYCGDAFASWTNGNSPDTTGYITFFNCYTTRTHADGFDFKEGSHHIKVINCSVDFENIEVDAKYGNSGVFSRANHVQVINCSFKNNLKGDRDCLFFQRKQSKDSVYYGIGSEMKQVNVENFKNYMYWTNQPDTKLYNDCRVSQCAGLIQPGSPNTATETDSATFNQMTWDGEGGGIY